MNLHRYSGDCLKFFFSWIYHIAKEVWGFKGLKVDESGKIDELLTRPIYILCILS